VVCRSPYMPCRYCRLSTDGGASHGDNRDCIAALQREAERLQKTLATQARNTTWPAHDASLSVQGRQTDVRGENHS
jgi:hypothetical protein